MVGCVRVFGLRTTGYKYWHEVYHHGRPNYDYQCDELFTLNLADMQTDSRGNRVTLDARLADIGERYGNDAIQYTTAAALAEALREFCAKRGLDFPE